MSGEAPAALRCQGVVFTYPGGTRALDGVDLEIATGQRVAIVGQNGSGKSTLVRQLNGLLQPDERIDRDRRCLGARTRMSPISPATSGWPSRIRIVRSSPDAWPRRSRSGPGTSDGPAAISTRPSRGALASVGLTGLEDSNPYDLGFSKRKLLAIASILSMGTPIVILDEPTTGQDARGVALVQSIVANLATEGRTVIAISHDLRFVAETFERVVVMREGRIILDGTPAEVFAEDNWPALASANLEPPLPALAGVALGTGATPTVGALIEALTSDRR